MPMDHQDGNQTGLFVTEEVTPGVLAANPVWYEREPNSYSDFGGNFAMTARMQLTHDRQHGRGEVTDNNPTAGWSEDLTPMNMRRLMQGYLYADAREKPSTNPLNGTRVLLTSVDPANKQFKAAAGLGSFLVGHIVLAEKFADPGNNLLGVVTAVAAGALTIGAETTMVADASPSTSAEVNAVGFQFAPGGVALSLPQGSLLLTAAVGGMLALGLTPGEWVAASFSDPSVNAPFYGRIAALTDTTITFDKTTGVQVADAAAGKTLSLYFGTVVRNESDCTLIKTRSYTMERQYGCGVGVQSDGVQGWVPDQLTITIPTPGNDSKVTFELTGKANTSYERLATEGVLAGAVGSTIQAAANEPCFKPGLDVYQNKLAVIDPSTLNPTALVSYNSEGTLVINNNTAANKAIEVFGNSGQNVGEFNVTGTLNAYWTDERAARAVRQNAELTWHLILTKNSQGAPRAVIFDVASLGLGNGRATVAANTPVKIPLDSSAGRGKFGYTLLTTFMRYVPPALLAHQ